MYAMHVFELIFCHCSMQQVSATDRDTVGGTVRYALTNANPFSALTQFSINRTTGELNLLQSLDRETDDTISLVVTASDMGEPGKLACCILKL